MSERFPFQSELRVERLVIVESDALEDRIPLLVSSNQYLVAQSACESTQEFSQRIVQRIAGFPSARSGLLMLGDDTDYLSRWASLLALASRLQGAENPELVISVRSGSSSEIVGWQLLEAATHHPLLRGVQLRLQFGPARSGGPISSVRSSVRSLELQESSMIA